MMKKNAKFLLMFFLVLLCSCGKEPSLGDKAEKEVNTVGGLYLEMLPDYTDRKAVVTVTNKISSVIAPMVALISSF